MVRAWKPPRGLVRDPVKLLKWSGPPGRHLPLCRSSEVELIPYSTAFKTCCSLHLVSSPQFLHHHIYSHAQLMQSHPLGGPHPLVHISPPSSFHWAALLCIYLDLIMTVTMPTSPRLYLLGANQCLAHSRYSTNGRMTALAYLDLIDLL